MRKNKYEKKKHYFTGKFYNILFSHFEHKHITKETEKIH